MSDMSNMPEIASAMAVGRPTETSALPFVSDIRVRMAVEVGATSIRMRDLMNLGDGSVVELDRPASDPLDIMVNGTLIARGEVVTINNRFGVRIIEIVKRDAEG